VTLNVPSSQFDDVLTASQLLDVPIDASQKIERECSFDLPSTLFDREMSNYPTAVLRIDFYVSVAKLVYIPEKGDAPIHTW
jgi:hypothetical protein